MTTLPSISCELGRISEDLSKVSISVARTEMRFTMPWSPPTKIQSPTLIGRSSIRITPDTKLEKMVCRPKPMPTDRAPKTMARLERSIPAAAIPVTAASRKPR